jgi:ketosteroid isomerase-like protein
MGEKEEIAQILRLQNEWMDAWVRRDLRRLEELLADDFVLTSVSSDTLVDRATWLRNALGPARGEGFHYDDLHIQIYKDAAIAHSRFSQRARMGDQDWSGEFLVTDVWVREKGSWRVASRHSSRPTGQRKEAPIALVARTARA